METTIREYFKDFFTEINFYTGNVYGRNAVGFDGWRNGNQYSFSTNQASRPEMLFHWMENIKGEIIIAEQKYNSQGGRLDNATQGPNYGNAVIGPNGIQGPTAKQ